LTVRSVILGLLGALLVVVLGHLNDVYVRVIFLIGHHMPMSVFGVLILLAVALNPLLWRLRPGWRLRPAELAVVLTMTLAACSLPFSGLMRTFTPSLIMPIHYNRISPGWRKADVLSYVPEAMLAGGGRYSNELIDGYISGLGGPGKWIGLGDVPWHLWRRTLSGWIPLVVLSFLTVIAISLILHRQWARRERLRYPIAELARLIVDQDPGHGLGPLFRSRLFWIGLGAVFLIRLSNGLHVWFPQKVVEIPLWFDFSALARRFPSLAAAEHAPHLIYPTIYPAALGFTFFVASDVSFSLGLSGPGYVLLSAILVSHGVKLTSTMMIGGVPSWFSFGAFVGMGLMLLYFGRRYYALALAGPLARGAAKEVAPYARWASWLFVATLTGMAVLLMRWGLAWPLAILLVAMYVLLVVVAARINAEGGVYFFQSVWFAPGIFIGLFGPEALGPTSIIIIGMVTIVLTIDVSQALLPYLINGLRLADRFGVSPARLGWSSAGVVLVALAIVVPLSLWAAYNFGMLSGTASEDIWATKMVPSMPFDAAVRCIDELSQAGRLELSEDLTGWQHLKSMRPSRGFLLAAGLGLAAILGASLLRLRYTWWPLHPFFFLFLGTWTVIYFSVSFLLGVALKTAVTRIGGVRAFRGAQRMMAGLIAGELLAGLMWIVVNWCYYVATGNQPKPYSFYW